MPGYQKRNRLRMSPILHPTDFADFALLYKIVCCLAIARQQLDGNYFQGIYVVENIIFEMLKWWSSLRCQGCYKLRKSGKYVLSKSGNYFKNNKSKKFYFVLLVVLPVL